MYTSKKENEISIYNFLNGKNFTTEEVNEINHDLLYSDIQNQFPSVEYNFIKNSVKMYFSLYYKNYIYSFRQSKIYDVISYCLNNCKYTIDRLSMVSISDNTNVLFDLLKNTEYYSSENKIYVFLLFMLKDFEFNGDEDSYGYDLLSEYDIEVLNSTINKFYPKRYATPAIPQLEKEKREISTILANNNTKEEETPPTQNEKETYILHKGSNTLLTKSLAVNHTKQNDREIIITLIKNNKTCTITIPLV